MTTDRKIEILLVEDNKDFAKLVQVYLQRYEKDRFAVTWRENHADAMAELESGKAYDVVLMDYFLPGKNGLEITKEMVMRKIDVPVVFLTAGVAEDDVERLRALPIAGVLRKPFDPMSLPTEVAALLGW